MCHECGHRCWYLLESIRPLVIGYRPLREVRYSQQFVSQWLDLLWEAEARDRT